MPKQYAMALSNTRILTDTKIKQAKPKDKEYKLTDGKGLLLVVKPNGSKLWRRRIYVNGRETMFAIGRYPDFSLADARNSAQEAFKLAREGVNPASRRKAARALTAAEQASTFRAIGKVWLAKKEKEWVNATLRQRQRLLTHYIFPTLGDLPVKEINSASVLNVLEKIHKAAPTQTAFARQCISGIMGQAIIRGLADADPVYILRGEHRAPKTVHHRPLQRVEIKPFLERLQAAHMQEQTRIAVRLAFWTLCRSCEVIGARWDEFDLDAATWSIPRARMKKREVHTVPLPRQAVTALKALRMLMPDREVLFPNARDPRRPAAATYLNKAVTRLRFEGFTAHGIRSTGSTFLNEMKFRSEVIDRQLSHVERNKTKASYNHAEYIDERRDMMQWWADMLDALALGTSNVQLLSKGAA
jgi:integrase